MATQTRHNTNDLLPFGAFVQHRRIWLGLGTQESLARRAGLNRNTVIKIESGHWPEAHPRGGSQERLAAALDLLSEGHLHLRFYADLFERALSAAEGGARQDHDAELEQHASDPISLRRIRETMQEACKRLSEQLSRRAEIFEPPERPSRGADDFRSALRKIDEALWYPAIWLDPPANAARKTLMVQLDKLLRDFMAIHSRPPQEETPFGSTILVDPDNGCCHSSRAPRPDERDWLIEAMNVYMKRRGYLATGLRMESPLGGCSCFYSRRVAEAEAMCFALLFERAVSSETLHQLADPGALGRPAEVLLVAPAFDAPVLPAHLGEGLPARYIRVQVYGEGSDRLVSFEPHPATPIAR